MSAVVYVFWRSGKNVGGQNDQQGKKATGQQAFLAGHRLLIGRYFAPCYVSFFILIFIKTIFISKML